MTTRLLIHDLFYPVPYAKWRIVEIEYFLDHPSYITDILITPVFPPNRYANYSYEESIKSWKYRFNYYILIFDSKYNSLNSLNPPSFDGRLFNGKYPHGFLLSRTSNFNLKYDIQYSIFLSLFILNSPHLPHIPHVCKIYPGGGYTNNPTIDNKSFEVLNKMKATAIVSQDSIYHAIKGKVSDVYRMYGVPLLRPTDVLKYKNPVLTGLHICISSLGFVPKKGLDTYLQLAAKCTDPRITFHIVGLKYSADEERTRRVKTHGVLPPDELDKFYFTTIDVITAPTKKFPNDSEGFPIGGEAILQGAIPVLADPYERNSTIGFTEQEGLIMREFDIDQVLRYFDQLLKDPGRRIQLSIAAQKKAWSLFHPNLQLTPINDIFRKIIKK